MRPAVSVLVPVFNVQKYLRKCLESLVRQTLTDIEIILINDGSTDDSLSIIREFERRDPRIVVLDKPNSGYGDSMNRGLALSTGKYVGIVEPDDFADLQMFERLWAVAESHDADVVKSNYFEYSTTGAYGERSEFVEALAGCQYDVVFKPIEHQEVFLRPPSIWSALYRKSFLDEENIRFLPTPGASFQDTGFFFKSLYSADRAVLVREGFIHYRIDNEGSSVKSQAKIFPICDEYAEIWSYAQRDSRKFDLIKKQLVREQFGGYLWNLDRLAPQVRHQFYLRMVDEYRQLSVAGLLDKAHFDQENWDKVSRMLADPSAYYAQAYGPEQVENTIVACLSGLEDESVIESVRVLLDMTGENDEIILVHECADALSCSLRGRDARSGRVFSCSDLFTSHLLFEVDPERVRGKEVAVVCASRRLTLNDATLFEYMALHAGLHYDESGVVLLSGKRNELFPHRGTAPALPLLIIESVVSHRLQEFFGVSGLGLVGLPVGSADAREFADAVEGLVRFSDVFAGNGVPYTLAREAYQLVMPFWNRVRDHYCTLSGSGLAEARPSFEKMFSAKSLAFNSDDVATRIVSPKVSVILPACGDFEAVSVSLASILNQDLRDIEVICVNDGAVGTALDELEKLSLSDRRVRLVSQLRGGRGAACNLGISLARGDALMFVRAGDCLSSTHALADLWNALCGCDALVCAGSVSFANQTGEVRGFPSYEDSFYSFVTEKDIPINQVWNDAGWNRCLYNTKLFAGGVSLFPHLSRYEASVFFLSAVCLSGALHVIPEKVCCHRLHNHSVAMSVSECRDFLTGIRTNLRVAARLRMAELYTTLIARINNEFYEDIIRNIADAEVLLLLVSIQGELRPDLILMSCDAGQDARVIRPLATLSGRIACVSQADARQEVSCSEPRDQAIVRFAKHVAGSPVYTGAQSLVWRAKSFVGRLGAR